MTARPAYPDYQTFARQVPQVHAALRALGQTPAGLDKELAELVKLRVSQVNGCAFCLQIHLNFARAAGVAQTRLDLLATWREAGVFTAREGAALRWAECLTELPCAVAASDDAYATLCAHFDADEILALTANIAGINAWNRVGAGLRFAPPPATGLAAT